MILLSTASLHIGGLFAIMRQKRRNMKIEQEDKQAAEAAQRAETAADGRQPFTCSSPGKLEALRA